MPQYRYQVTITNQQTNEQTQKQLTVTAPTQEQALQNIQLAYQHLHETHTIAITPN